MTLPSIRSLLLLATFAAFSSAPSALATGYNVSGSGGGYSGSGTLTATDQGGGQFLITAMSGTGFQGMFAPGGFNGNDNLLFPTGSQYVDASGFAFTISNGTDTDNVDIYSAGSNYYAYLVDEGGNVSTVQVTFNLAANSSASPAMARSMNSLFALNTSSEQGTSTQFSFSFQPALDQGGNVTPEPSSFALLGTGLAGVATKVWRRRRS